MLRRTPLAWLDLLHHRRRFAMSVTGVAFAVFLIFVEVGFLNGVYDSQTDLVSHFNAELIIVNRLKEDVRPLIPFSRGIAIQALAVDGVADVYPVYADSGRWKNLDERVSHFALTLGFNPSHPVLDLPELARHQHDLQLPETTLFDRESRPFFGTVKLGQLAEFERKRIVPIATFSLGPDFRTDGMLLMSDTNFLRYFPNPVSGEIEPDRIEFGLVRLAPGYSAADLRTRLTEALPDDVSVLTKPELMQRVRGYWKRSKSVGMVFGIGAAVGFTIGVIICYQILFTDISDNFPQYATLSAMGYSGTFLMKVVLQKALLLSLFGFIPGLLLSGSLYSALQRWTGIRMWMTPDRVGTVLLMSVGMCVIAGMLALFKVLKADPAELY